METRVLGIRHPRLLPVLLATLGAACAAEAASVGVIATEALELKKKSLAELMDIEVTSVSKRAESVYDAAASIFVITAEDIRRSGATTIPEILRLAPNLQVARLDADDYAITARGFLASTANKLLVLMDGRTVYTPLFSGVFWDAQDTLVQDIERIEVISGPGATLWGSNAVNGVINIITKGASDTHGAQVVGDAGDVERGVSLRHGGTLGARASYRVYGKFNDWDHTDRADGTKARDDWDKGQVGFRTDWTNDKDGATFQGDLYDGSLRADDAEIAGGNLLARWSRQLQGDDRLQVQAYFDYTHRDIPGVFAQDLQTWDVELQHFLRPHASQAITWGGGYRYADDDVENSAVLAFIPAERDLTWGNAFVQDEVTVIEDSVYLTLGVKADYNPYTHFEFLPSARLAWKLAPEHLLWSSLSRAVRAPSRIDTEFFVPSTPPFLLQGGPEFRSELSNVLESGYRGQPTPNSSVSVTIFHSELDRVRSFAGAPGSMVFANGVEGESTGIEAWGSYQPTAFWTLKAGMVYMDTDLRLKSGGPVPPDGATEGNDPHYQWTLRSWFDLPADFDLDVQVRGVGALPNPEVPSYTELDLRLAWHALDSLELSVVGRNLLHGEHFEFATNGPDSEIDRSVLLRAVWSF